MWNFILGFLVASGLWAAGLISVPLIRKWYGDIRTKIDKSS